MMLSFLQTFQGILRTLYRLSVALHILKSPKSVSTVLCGVCLLNLRVGGQGRRCRQVMKSVCFYVASCQTRRQCISVVLLPSPPDQTTPCNCVQLAHVTRRSHCSMSWTVGDGANLYSCSTVVTRASYGRREEAVTWTDNTGGFIRRP